MNEFEEPDLTARLRDMAGGNECHLAYRAAEVITVLREIRGHNEKELADFCRQLERELAAAQKDAARYRWLRGAGAWESEIGMDVLSENPEAFDAAVDARMNTG